jgi:uncharacterized coiled-coil protein SlyX
MSAELLGSIFGIIATFGGIIRWLIQAWSKQSQLVQELRKNITDRSISDLNDVVEKHKTAIGQLDSTMKALKLDLMKASDAGIKSINANNELSKKLDSYVEATGRNIDIMKTEVKKLTQDFIMVKGKIVGSKENK